MFRAFVEQPQHHCLILGITSFIQRKNSLENPDCMLGTVFQMGMRVFGYTQTLEAQSFCNLLGRLIIRISGYEKLI